MYCDSFGFIPEKASIRFDRGHILPRPDFEKSLVRWRTAASKRRLIHPPAQNVEQGMPLQRLASSHDIELRHRGLSTDREVVRRGIGGFCVHLAGFLYGYRCQFSGWWIDGPIPANRDTDMVVHRESDAGHVFSNALRLWARCTQRQQTVLTNILYMFPRSELYAFDWERLAAAYQVFDAIYAFARSQNLLKETSHSGRIEAMCRAFNVPQNKPLTKRIVGLRNDLIHEVLWDGGMPGTKKSDDAYYAPLFLNHLSSRLLLRVFGVQSEYSSTEWWGLSECLFRRKR